MSDTFPRTRLDSIRAWHEKNRDLTGPAGPPTSGTAWWGDVDYLLAELDAAVRREHYAVAEQAATIRRAQHAEAVAGRLRDVLQRARRILRPVQDEIDRLAADRDAWRASARRWLKVAEEAAHDPESGGGAERARRMIEVVLDEHGRVWRPAREVTWGSWASIMRRRSGGGAPG